MHRLDTKTVDFKFLKYHDAIKLAVEIYEETFRSMGENSIYKIDYLQDINNKIILKSTKCVAGENYEKLSWS